MVILAAMGLSIALNQLTPEQLSTCHAMARLSRVVERDRNNGNAISFEERIVDQGVIEGGIKYNMSAEHLAKIRGLAKAVVVYVYKTPEGQSPSKVYRQFLYHCGTSS